MKTICKSLFSSCLFGLVAIVIAMPALAQSAAEPAIVVSISSIKEQIKDVSYLMEASGFGQMKFLAKSQMKHFTRGISADAPGGVLMYFEGDDPMPRIVGFLPVENLDDFLDTISGFMEVDDSEDDIIVSGPDGQELVVRESGENIFISNSADSLKDLPEDPQSMLGELPTKYNMAAHIFGNRVPDELRKKAIDMIKDGYADQLRNMGEEVAEVQIENFEKQIALLEDIDELKIGMLADKDAQKLAMEFEMKVAPGSKMAESYAMFGAVEPTRFGGFMSDAAALDYNTCFGIKPEDTEQYTSSIDTAIDAVMTELENDGELTDDEVDTVRGAVTELAEVLGETFQSGRIDSGGQIMMEGTEVNLVAGAEIANPQKVENAAKDLIELAQSKAGDKISVNLNSGSYKGVNLHEVVIHVPEDEEELQDFIGSEIKILLGIGKKDVYLAAGTSPLDRLKAAMDSKSTEPPEFPIVYNVRITPILEFFANTTGQPMLDELTAKMKEIGRDKITIYSKAIENGMFTRAEMDDGPLGLIQTAVMNFQQQFAEPADF